MTALDTRPVVESGPAPSSLADLVGDTTEFFAHHWANQPVVLRAQGDLSALITEEEIWEEIDCGLLSRPYFTVFDEGVRPAISDMIRTRTVVGHELTHFINEDKIRSDFAAGATFKLNQAEHWHPRTRRLVTAMAPSFEGILKAFVFLSPPRKTAMRAHTDGAHVFVLQISGDKDWVVGTIDDKSHSDSTLHDGEIDPAHSLHTTLHPGDVLYMPHGCPHYATARDGNSIHVAITVEEPTAEDLANVFMASFLVSTQFAEANAAFSTTDLSQTLTALRGAAEDYLATVSDETVFDKAVALRRSTT
jgi:ribosomal protein L16 Arg81 hydroxylase